MIAGSAGKVKPRGTRRLGSSVGAWVTIIALASLLIPAVVFAASASADPSVSPTRYEQTSSNIAYQGSWVTFKTSGASGGTYKYLDSTGKALLAFTGTKLDLLATKGYTMGKAQVSLDGGTPVTVDFYHSTTQRQQKVYSTGTLTSGAHTVTLTWTGQKSVSGGGHRVNLDAVQVTGTLTKASFTSVSASAAKVTSTRYEQTSSAIAYQGSWVTFKTSGASGGTYKYLDSTGKALLAFTGTKLDLLATKGYTMGKAQVSLDGGAPVTVDFYHSTTQRQQKVYSTGTLTSGAHTVTLTWTGQKSVSGGGTRVNIDAVEVVGALGKASTAAPATTTTTTAAPATTPTTTPPKTPADPTTPTTLAPTTTTTSVGQSTGKTYYVDATGGSDKNSGLSPGSAWKTLSKVTSYGWSPGFAAGVSILFKRGEVWREQFVINSQGVDGKAGSPITFGDYGAGAKPVFSGGLVLSDSGDWTSAGSNIWRHGSMTAYDIGNVVFNGGTSCGAKQWSSLGSGNAQGDFYYDMSNHVLYLKSVGNPATVYESIEACQKFTSAMGSSCGVYGTHDYLTFRNLVFQNYGYHGIIVGNGSSNIIFEDCDFAWLGGGYDGAGTNTSDGYAIEFFSGITDSTIRYCTFSDIYNFAVSLQSWGSNAYTFANVYIYGNTMTRCGCGGFENWYASTGAQKVSNVVFARNVVYGTALSKFRMQQVPYVFTITGATGGNVSMSGCKVVDNIFGPTLNRYSWLGSTGFLSGWTIDYNCYSPLNDEFAYVGGAKTWSYWKSTLGLDGHSVTSDPLFVNPAGGNFRLGSTSPCIGAGVFVSGVGASGSTVNIGAY